MGAQQSKARLRGRYVQWHIWWWRGCSFFFFFFFFFFSRCTSPPLLAGQSPAYKRTRKFGFTNAVFKRDYTEINLQTLERMAAKDWISCVCSVVSERAHCSSLTHSLTLVQSRDKH